MEIDLSLEALQARWPEVVPSIDSLNVVHRGKVRELYDAGPDRFVMTASDRISAFDVVMNEPISNKGRVLTQLSLFWFELLSDIAPNHVRGVSGDGRSLLVAKAEMAPIECIVRGYISGSGWKEYRDSGTLHGAKLAPGMVESDRLPRPIFTPSTKAAMGIHDENISFEQACDIVGKSVALELEELSIALYERAANLALERGIIIADTKFEFGYVDGALTLCDEVLTPDSSRFWPADQWKPGITPPALDKQPLRDWLETMEWDKNPPPPALPASVVAATEARYNECFERLTGQKLPRLD